MELSTGALQPRWFPRQVGVTYDLATNVAVAQGRRRRDWIPLIDYPALTSKPAGFVREIADATR